MLKSTFIHIPSVGAETEKKILCTCKDWYDFDGGKLGFCSDRVSHIERFVDMSIDSYKEGNFTFFSSLLPSNATWRCLNSFKPLFLDIETTGLSKYYHEVTMIGVYDGKKVHTFVNGENLDEFTSFIKDYPMIVTFNGRGFDVPFLEHKFKFKMDQIHVDLRQAFGALGVRGGLKNIERAYGLKRSEETDGMTGFDAVRLWKRHKRGDSNALELLKKYNEDDVVGLKELSDIAFNGLREL